MTGILIASLVALASMAYYVYFTWAKDRLKEEEELRELNNQLKESAESIDKTFEYKYKDGWILVDEKVGEIGIVLQDAFYKYKLSSIVESLPIERDENVRYFLSPNIGSVVLYILSVVALREIGFVLGIPIAASVATRKESKDVAYYLRLVFRKTEEDGIQIFKLPMPNLEAAYFCQDEITKAKAD